MNNSIVQYLYPGAQCQVEILISKGKSIRWAWANGTVEFKDRDDPEMWWIRVNKKRLVCRSPQAIRPVLQLSEAEVPTALVEVERTNLVEAFAAIALKVSLTLLLAITPAASDPECDDGQCEFPSNRRPGMLAKNRGSGRFAV